MKKMKGYGSGIMLAIFIAFFFLILMLGSMASSNCAAVNQIRNAGSSTTPLGFVGDTVNLFASLVQPCGGIPFWVTAIIILPFIIVIALALAEYIPFLHG